MIPAGLEGGYAVTPVGRVHYVGTGHGEPVVLLHQTPRSWDEYRELLPMLGSRCRAIAVDTPGFGGSVELADHSIEAYAKGVMGVLDALELSSVTLLGHHTGGVVAFEVAQSRPDQVSALILSSTPYVDEEFRRRRTGGKPIDHVERRADGEHLAELWRRRAGFYPDGRVDILERFVADALHHIANVEAGHRAVANYRMEDRTPFDGRTLLIGADADPYAYPELERLAAVMPHADTTVIAGGTVALMEQLPSEVVTAVEGWLW